MRVKTPVIVINFKVYRESTGQNAFKLGKLAEKVAKETGKSIVVCPPHTDIALLSHDLEIPVWAQGADAVEPGGYTAHVPIEAAGESGARGILINHSEARLKIADIEYITAKAEKMGLESCICTNNVATSIACAGLRPGFIAVEPPELIGGTISVTTADPGIVSHTVEAVKEVSTSVQILCGAGVKNGRDVAAAIKLGSVGVLVASGVVKAKDPEAAIRDLASGI